MAKEWTDEEVKQEIADAVRIVREDKFEGFVRQLVGRPAGSVTVDDKDSGKGEVKSPPRGAPVEGATATKKRSLWWGELSNE
jgi:hypothetical protein